ncbi:MAG: hypothetical protein ABI542_08325 [Gemmatimonadota bacterium]
MFDEEDRIRRGDDDDATGATGDEEMEDVFAAGGLDERLNRRQAIAQLLREVGGC